MNKLNPPQDIVWWLESVCSTAQATANDHDQHQPLMIAFTVKNGEMDQQHVCPLGSLMEKSKDLARYMAHTFLNHIKADGYFFIHEAWYAEVPVAGFNPETSETQASKLPNRRDILRVEVRMRDGEALGRMMYQSNLTGIRFDGEWEVLPVTGTGLLANFFDAVPKDFKVPRHDN